MPRSTSMAVRQQIVQRFSEGLSISEISRQLKVSRSTIHRLLGQYQTHGSAGLVPQYSHCGKTRPPSDDFIFRAVRCLKAWHPGWGGEKIHAEITQARPDLALPSIRTLYRWFRWNGQTEAKTRFPRPDRKWAKALHEGWQIDAKEELTTADQTRQCWLNIIDECSGTVIDPVVFSL